MVIAVKWESTELEAYLVRSHQGLSTSPTVRLGEVRGDVVARMLRGRGNDE